MKYTDYASGYPSAKDFYEYLKLHRHDDIILIDTNAFTTDSKTNCRISIKVKDDSGEWKIPRVDTGTFNVPFAPKSTKYESKPRLTGNKFSKEHYVLNEDKTRALKPDVTDADANHIYMWAELFSNMLQEAVKKALDTGAIAVPTAKGKQTKEKIPCTPSKDVTFWPLVKAEGLYQSFQFVFNNKKWNQATRTPVKQTFTLSDGRTVEDEVFGTRVYDETDTDGVGSAKLVEVSASNINDVITPHSTVLALVSIPRITLHSKGISPTTEITALTVIRSSHVEDVYIPSIKSGKQDAEPDI